MYDPDDPNKPDFEQYLSENGWNPDGTALPEPAPQDNTTPVTLTAADWDEINRLNAQYQLATQIAAQLPAGTVMEPDQLAAYQAWVAAGAVGEIPAWILVNRALQRQQDAAAAALAILAQQPPEIRAKYDLGGTGYGSATTIVALANPGANYNDVINQATALQAAADAAGVLPADLVAQIPTASKVGTSIDPSSVIPPTTDGGTGQTQNPTPLPPSPRKRSGILDLALIGVAGWFLLKKKAA
jgi:hypothetical protein